jgi:hypothetical protein
MENNPALGREAGARAHRVGPATPTPEVDSAVSLESPEMYRKGVMEASRAPPFFARLLARVCCNTTERSWAMTVTLMVLSSDGKRG